MNHITKTSKQTDTALIASETRYRRLFESAQDGILILNADTGEIVDANPFLLDMLDFSLEEVLGKELWEIGLFKDIAANKAAFLQLQNQGYIRYEDLPLETKDGKKHDVEFVSNTYQVDNTKVIQCNIRDITARKLAEAKVREIDKMKTDFLANVSHELRSPLQSISGFTKLLLRHQVPDRKSQQEFLEIIDEESQYLGNMINSLLDISRLESGRFEINKQPTQIRETIIDALKIFKTLIREKKITLKEEIPEGLPEIEADGIKLRQVFINLVGNAIKFSESSGEITVRVENLQNQELFCQVSDRGIGITAKHMSHLFERFYRADDKNVPGGAGLGLYISKEIIKAHGGHIWVESQDGKGSTFSFILPMDGKGGDVHGKEDSNNRR